MKKYKVYWTTVTKCSTIIEANTEEDAIDIACYVGEDEITEENDSVEDFHAEEIK